MKCRNSQHDRNPCCASTLHHWSLLPVPSIAYLPTCACHPVPFSVHTAPPFIHSPLSLRPETLTPAASILLICFCTRISSPQLHPLLSIPVIFTRLVSFSVQETKFLHYLPQFLQIKYFYKRPIETIDCLFFYYSTKFKQTLAEFFIGLA